MKGKLSEPNIDISSRLFPDVGSYVAMATICCLLQSYDKYIFSELVFIQK